MDRPELREKIEELTETICFAVRAYERFDISREELQLIDNGVNEDLLALIPDTEELREQYDKMFKRAKELLVEAEEAKKQAYSEGIEWGRFQERGRIIKLAERTLYNISNVPASNRIGVFIEALKEEK